MNETKTVINTPIVFERRKKKKKKVFPALGDLQITERYLTKAMHRSIRAADEGMVAYRSARKKSARKSRDGAILSFIPNVVKGTSVTMRELAPVPYDLLRAGYTPQARRIIRLTVRSAARLADDMLP